MAPGALGGIRGEAEVSLRAPRWIVRTLWILWGVVAAAAVTLTLVDVANALESPHRSPLVVPAADCPNLPTVYRTNRQFDDLFRRAAAKHWPSPLERNWCWLKAQAAAESGLKPRATSPVGAKGLTQFMDPTLAEVGRQLHRTLDPFDARDSIEAQAVYMWNLRKQWTSPRPETEAFRLAWASYNAGLGSILCGQRKAHGALLWNGIEPSLHLCTGRHADETRGYVKRISRFTGFTIEPPKSDVPPPEIKPAVCAP